MDYSSNSDRRTKQKRDPAWNYCEMLKDEDKVQLKCMFCGKIFKGGGIHRVKEHLAGVRGDGGTPCMSVDPAVRLALQENLSGLVGKRRKKRRTFSSGEMLTPDHSGLHSNSDLNAGANLFHIADAPEPETNLSSIVNHDPASLEVSGGITEGESIKTRTRSGRRKANMYQLANHMSPIPIGSHKRDVAWKHCQMYNNGGKTLLKCLYCGKVFNGGGIYRVKEHLAGRTGSGPVCLEVLPDVRILMQESLKVKGSIVRRGKRGKTGTGMPISEVHAPMEGCDLDADGISNLLEAPIRFQHDPNALFGGETDDERTGSKIENGQINTSDLELPLNSERFILDDNAPDDPRPGNDLVQMAIGRFFFYSGTSFDAVDSVYFQRMIQAVAVASQGPHVAIPSRNDLRSWILKNSVQEVRSDVEQFTMCWEQTSCSILLDEWIAEGGKTYVNMMAACPGGTLFLESMDISDTTTYADTLLQTLSKVIEKVGEKNVTQVITRGDEKYDILCRRLMDSYPSIFWTPCASHCITLMLEDLKKLEWITAMIEQAKSISRFIYNHNSLITIMRRYTFGIDLIGIGVTQPATDFMTLARMVCIKQSLQQMVTSEEWTESPYSREPEGLAVMDCFSSESFWSTCDLISRLTDPLLRLLRIVTSEKRPALGYVYAGLCKAKETIKKELIHQKDFLAYWNIIDQRSEKLWHHPLIAAGFYLNPKYFYSTGGNMHHLRSLLYDCVEKLVTDPTSQDKIVKETINYQNAVGDFGRKMAIRARETLLPAEWWSTYGAACPNLAGFAIRILNQTSSLLNNVPNHLSLVEMHEVKNCLERQRLKDLVFLQYNLWLREWAQEKKDQEPVDPLCSHSRVAEDWVSKKESHSEDQSSSDWTTVDPPLANIMLGGGPAVDDFEALGTGFDDLEIFNLKENEEEGGDRHVQTLHFEENLEIFNAKENEGVEEVVGDRNIGFC